MLVGLGFDVAVKCAVDVSDCAVQIWGTGDGYRYILRLFSSKKLIGMVSI